MSYTSIIGLKTQDPSQKENKKEIKKVISVKFDQTHGLFQNQCILFANLKKKQNIGFTTSCPCGSKQEYSLCCYDY